MERIEFDQWVSKAARPGVILRVFYNKFDQTARPTAMTVTIHGKSTHWHEDDRPVDLSARLEIPIKDDYSPIMRLLETTLEPWLIKRFDYDELIKWIDQTLLRAGISYALTTNFDLFGVASIDVSVRHIVGNVTVEADLHADVSNQYDFSDVRDELKKKAAAWLGIAF